MNRFLLALLAVLMIGAVSVPEAKAAPESYELVQGTMVFVNQTRHDQAKALIEDLANRPRFRDVTPTIRTVPAGKYGAGPTLLVTLRMSDRSDADALWQRALQVKPFLLNGSQLLQSHTELDVEGGVRPRTTVIHRHTLPARVDDIQ